MTRNDIDNNLEKIIELYEKGMTVKELSEKYGASTKTIMKRIINELSEEEIELLKIQHRKSHVHESINKHRPAPPSGYYRVYTQKANNIQGFVYVYEAPEGKRLSSKDIGKLKDKVVLAGYEWKRY